MNAEKNQESYLHKIPFTPTELSLEREAMKSIYLKLMRKILWSQFLFNIIAKWEKMKWNEKKINNYGRS